MSVAALEEIEQARVGDAIAERVVAALQTAYLVQLAQA
jgi:hypothetical protein